MFLLVDAAMDPLQDLRESTAPNKAQLIAARIELLDLDTPVVLRYFEWLGDAVTGDFGIAWRSSQPVKDLLAHAIGSTLQLVTAATFLALVLGVTVGIVSALRQYSGFDYLIIFLSFLLYSLPSFWVAVLLKQWGAIGFNDFLADPVISWSVIAVVARGRGPALDARRRRRAAAPAGRPSGSPSPRRSRCSPSCSSPTGGTPQIGPSAARSSAAGPRSPSRRCSPA